MILDASGYIKLACSVLASERCISSFVLVLDSHPKTAPSRFLCASFGANGRANAANETKRRNFCTPIHLNSFGPIDTLALAPLARCRFRSGAEAKASALKPRRDSHGLLIGFRASERTRSGKDSTTNSRAKLVSSDTSFRRAVLSLASRARNTNTGALVCTFGTPNETQTNERTNERDSKQRPEVDRQSRSLRAFISRAESYSVAYLSS